MNLDSHGVCPLFRFQNVTTLRIDSPEQFQIGERIVLSGLNGLTGRGLQVNAVVVGPVPGTSRLELNAITRGFRMRPEAMTAAALYNARFADLFAAFARRRGLYVAWLGCQHESTTCEPEPLPEEPMEIRLSTRSPFSSVR